MTELPLQFRYSSHPQRPTCARFIAGGDPALWLEELTTWDVPLDTLRLFPVPRSRSDNACLGVLVSLEGVNAGRELRLSGETARVESPLNPPCPPFVRGGARRLTSEYRGELKKADIQRFNTSELSRTQPYGRVANRLFLPVEAAVLPDLHEVEWRELLGPQTTTHYVWHPQAGLVAFAPEEVLSVTDLLSPQWPVETAADTASGWGFARAGMIFPHRITALRAELPASAAEMLADGRDDIGTQSKNLKQLTAPVSDQLKAVGQTALGLALLPFSLLVSLVGRLFAAGRRGSTAPTGQNGSMATPEWLAGLGSVVLVAGLISLVYLISAGAASILPFLLAVGAAILVSAFLGAMGGGGGVGGPGRPASALPLPAVGMIGFGGFGARFQKQLGNLMRWTAGLLDARRREMDRLMKLLHDDPDEGLKYALPMSGDARRGIAPPTGWLARRMVDFQLGGGGGGPADVWDLPPETQFQLIKRYRELAAREVQLGRYRRAAYIFAELLGDLTSAATTLENGRFYREAAVLYRDKLNRPLDAAHCLERGGLLLEAIPIYRQHLLLEKVGDLYRRLDDFEAAETAYREAVEKALAKRHYQEAANLLVEKLDSPDEALATLDAGWRESDHARRCLEAHFALLTKLGRHEDTVRRIRDLREAKLSSPRTADAVEVLAATAVGAPHAESRHVAADTVRVLAARALAIGHTNRQQMTSAVGRLAPEDRLLARDCKRAAENRPWEKNRSTSEKSTATARNPKSGLRLVKTFQLPEGINWTSACETERNFYVMGRKGDEIVVARGAWNDPTATVSSVSWNHFHNELANVLMCHSTWDRTLHMASTGGFDFAPREFRATDANPDGEYAATPSWASKSISAITAAPSGTVFTFQLLELLLSGFSTTGLSLSCETLLIPMQDQTVDPNATYPLVARSDAVYLAVGRHLIESCSGRSAVIQDMHESIIGLTAAPPGTGPRLAVLFEERVALFWDKLNADRNDHSTIGLADPQAVFLRNHQLVIHGRGGWKIYNTSGDKMQLLQERPCDIEGDAFGLLRPGMARQVGLCTTDGLVRVYELP